MSRGHSVRSGEGGHKKEINILILGQTGVGKTTWINAFYNYVRYSSVEEAEIGGLKCLIPLQITMTDEHYNDVIVELGQSPNEVYKDGESCTKDPFSHEFLFGNRLVRLIDTPGIGDSAGISQDMKNFKKIVSHLQSVHQIHAILLLLKPNEARLDVTFQFCLKQLMVNLPREAVKNIVFCFTNSRGTNYKPGETLKTLKTLFSTGLESEIPIKLHKDTMYMFDSESVRFLAAKTKGIKFSPLECTTFSSSWKISVTETERLFDHVSRLEPVPTGTVATINETREIIQLLQKPIIDISALIQENIQNVETIQREISMGHDRYQELYDQAIPIKTINFKKLKTPRTVCASPKCTAELDGSSIRAPQQQQQQMGVTPLAETSSSKKTKTKKAKPVKVLPPKHYKSICHDNCKIFAFKFLGWTCECFDYKLNCKKCKCAFSKHISVDFETCIVEEADTELEKRLGEAHSEVERKRIISENSQRAMEQLQKEQEAILKASAVFANFLRANAILNFNDAVADYMKVLIKVEKESDDSAANKKLEGLVKMLEAYQVQVQIEKSISSHSGGGSSHQNMTAHDIFDVLEKLYLLPRMGSSIKFLVEETRADAKAHFEPKSNKVAFEDEGGVGIIGKTGIMRQLWSRSKDNTIKLAGTGDNVGWGTLDATGRDATEVTEIKPKKPVRVKVPYPSTDNQQPYPNLPYPQAPHRPDLPAATSNQPTTNPWDMIDTTPPPPLQRTIREPSPPRNFDNPIPYPTGNPNPVPYPRMNPNPISATTNQNPNPSPSSSVLDPSPAKPTSSLLASILAQPSSSSNATQKPLDMDQFFHDIDDKIEAYTTPAATANTAEQVETREEEEEADPNSGFDFSKLRI